MNFKLFEKPQTLKKTFDVLSFFWRKMREILTSCFFDLHYFTLYSKCVNFILLVTSLKSDLVLIRFSGIPFDIISHTGFTYLIGIIEHLISIKNLDGITSPHDKIELDFRFSSMVVSTYDINSCEHSIEIYPLDKTLHHNDFIFSPSER